MAVPCHPSHGLNGSDDPLAPHSLSPSELQELLAAEKAGTSFLVFRDGTGALGLFPAGQGAVRTIGRRPEMDLSIAWDPEVSGLHAEIQRIGGEWTIVDDGLSRNGTHVNGQRINGRQRLRDGDRIRIGRTTIAFKAAGVALVQETVATGETATLQQLTDNQRRVLVALCRPYRDGAAFTKPSTNQEIAAEVFLSVEAVKMHLRALFAKFELTELPQNEKRARLAECALRFGVIDERDLA